MKVLVLDGHPDSGRLVSALLDHYQSCLPAGTPVVRLNVRDLDFSPNMRRGYAEPQPWEPDLEMAANAIADCDHIVIGFPLWWGAEPAILKGFLDRVIVPGFAFRYHRENIWWDKLLAGRSADLIVTMDTPPWYLWLVLGDSVIRRWRAQILGFCGVKPIRVYRLGMTRRGAAAKNIGGWKRRLQNAAESSSSLRRGKRAMPEMDWGTASEALKERD